METENTFVITPTCMDPLSVQHTWALLLMPLQLLYSPQTFSFFSLLSLVYAALFFLASSLFFCFLFFTFSALRCIVLSFFFFFFSSSLLSLVYAALFFFFLPFCLSHLRPIKKKKNQWLGQRIGCCGFVNFLGASSLEPKWLLLWALGVEGKKKGMLGLKSLVLGGNGVRGVSQQECLTCCSGMGSTKSRKKIKWREIEKCVPNEV